MVSEEFKIYFKSITRFILDFAIFVAIYGSLINATLIIFNIPFDLYHIFSYGFMYYIIKKEMPEILKEYLGRRR